MKTYNTKNCTTGVRVTSKFKALMLAKVWKMFLLQERNFICSLKNYYDVNGYLTNKQYNVLSKMYDNYIEKYTEKQVGS